MTVLKNVLCLFYVVYFPTSANSLNYRPIIGVIAQETNGSEHASYGTSYITASYVKFLEAAGARVVPVKVYETRAYYRDLMHNINGVLYPGGEDILQSSGFGRTGKIIFDLAKQMNKRGDYFPLWGTCLGFELLNFAAVHKLWFATCECDDLASPLTFLPEYLNSRMFRNMDEHLRNILQFENVTFHYHHWCLTPSNFSVSGLDRFYSALSIGESLDDILFISSIEARDYPFFGVAFHPEKVLFEWVTSNFSHSIPHTKNAVKLSQYLANFFVDEARKSFHKFPDKRAEDEVLIYNYSPKFTGPLINKFTTEQNYYFNFTSDTNQRTL